MVTKTVYREVEVELDLNDFDDDQIEAEYKARFGEPDIDDELEKIWLAMRQNDENTAYDLMRDYVYDKLGKVV